MRVRILKPCKSAMQSAGGEAGWLVQPVRETPVAREPLMGWVSADDPLSSLTGRLKFPTQEAAVAFARRRGWAVEIVPVNERVVVPKNYVDNFNPDRRRDGR